MEHEYEPLKMKFWRIECLDPLLGLKSEDSYSVTRDSPAADAVGLIADSCCFRCEPL